MLHFKIFLIYNLIDDRCHQADYSQRHYKYSHKELCAVLGKEMCPYPKPGSVVYLIYKPGIVFILHAQGFPCILGIKRSHNKYFSRSVSQQKIIFCFLLYPQVSVHVDFHVHSSKAHGRDILINLSWKCCFQRDVTISFPRNSIGYPATVFPDLYPVISWKLITNKAISWRVIWKYYLSDDYVSEYKNEYHRKRILDIFHRQTSMVNAIIISNTYSIVSLISLMISAALS